ncbi:hypothetical protein T484DRAFT_1867473 [Baffinella frigidus]|nr:hypothetical protein T484DRAFT_1867473 [Cryptophyta sp. CCMP2293]
MTSGIDASAVILVCVTQRYVEKVAQSDIDNDNRPVAQSDNHNNRPVAQSENHNDNCRLEFQYAMRRKSAAKMVPATNHTHPRYKSWT